jgi:hypothetical protein
MTLEYTGLRVMNVENLGGGSGDSATDVRKVDLGESLGARLGAANKTKDKKTLRNVGPSITYKLRDAAGQAREFHNYMLPVDLGEGVPVFLMGMRETPAESFRYMRIPADEKGGMDGFLQMRAALTDPRRARGGGAQVCTRGDRPRPGPSSDSSCSPRRRGPWACSPARSPAPAGRPVACRPCRSSSTPTCPRPSAACRRGAGAHPQWRPVRGGATVAREGRPAAAAARRSAPRPS